MIFFSSYLAPDIEAEVKPPLTEMAGDEVIWELFKEAILLKPEKGIILRGKTLRGSTVRIGG